MAVISIPGIQRHVIYDFRLNMFYGQQTKILQKNLQSRKQRMKFLKT